MSTEAERADQRRAWRQALAAAAAVKRNNRYRRAAPQPRAGMLRKDGTVAILRDGLARCLFPGCPVRYASGGDRLCRDHAAETAAGLAARMAGLAGTAPGDTSDGSDAQ